MAINFPSSPTNGQVYTDTTSGMTWVYSTTDTAWSGSFNRSNYVSQTFTATSGQTNFTISGGYLPTLVEVYQNGVLLVNGTDVTVTSGTSVVLTVGATTGDIIQVIGNQTFNVAAIDASSITSGTLPVARGGTGLSSPGTSGNVLTSNGTAWTSAAPASSVINAQTFTSSGTWTKPAGYSASSRVLVQAWGGGGGGGKNTPGSSPAGGGGGGGYNERWMTLSQFGATETITIGAGGTATTANGSGGAGGNTTVGSLITTYGGRGGASTFGGGGGGPLSVGLNEGAGQPQSWYTYDGSVTQLNGGGGSGTFRDGAPAMFHGGGGGFGGAGTGNPGGNSVWGGGGGGGSHNAGSAASTSVNGGAGGGGGGASSGTAGTQPGGGGGATATGTTSGAGAAGQVIITVFPA